MEFYIIQTIWNIKWSLKNKNSISYFILDLHGIIIEQIKIADIR